MKQNADKEIRFYEELAANGHVALNVIQYDGWILRFSQGHTVRANAVSMIYPSYLDPEEKIAWCEKAYARENQPCIFKLTEGDEEFHELLIRRGYHLVGTADVLTMEIDEADMPEGDIEFFDHPDEEWLKPFFRLEGLSDHNQSVYRQMLDRVCADTQYVLLKENGKAVAVASSVTEHGHVLIQNVITDPGCRGKGYGRKVCCALLAKAKENGSKTAWLQVVQENITAYRLYESLGLTKKYTYWFLANG